MEIILGKLGELVLKGLNRGSFEQRLKKNIAYRLSAFGEFRVYIAQSTVYMEPCSADADLDAAFEAAETVFGMAGLSRAFSCEKNLEAIVAAAVEKLSPALTRAATFKVESRRADKTFPITSPEISRQVGGALAERFPHLKVDVRHPEATVHVEIRDFAAFVHMDPVPGAGGLPVGTGGRACLLLSGGIDSPVAAHMMAKRGLKLCAVHFFSYPYTSERSKQKVLTLAGHLTRYCGDMTVHVVPFTRIQEEISKKCREEYFTLVMRRFMMRIAERIARGDGCEALVTGESLGQVASQTIRAIGVTEAVCGLPVFRPCIGLDKEEIVRTARKIGTFETSILPYEDCCTVFTPKHPKTRPEPGRLVEAETALEVEVLVEEALAGVERIDVGMSPGSS